MATISKIRQYYWLLVVMMVLALIGWFFMGSKLGRNPGAGTGTVGKVNGKKIGWNDMQYAESVLYQGSSGDYLGQRAYVWNYFVERAILEDKAKALGLGVPNKELGILQFGQNGKFYSDIIKQRLANPQTRRVDQQKLDQIKQLLVSGQLPEDYKRFWAFQQKEIVKDRLQSKYAALIAKAAYTPKWMAEMIAADKNKKADIAYVKIPFSAIPDDQVELTDKDYKDYIKENEAVYWRKEPSRKIAYVIFPIAPSRQDSMNIRQELAKLKTEFEKTTNDSLFLVRQGDGWDPAYLTENRLPRNMSKDLMELPVGTVVGPYLQGSKYVISKILDRKIIPDSVRARHILVKANDQASFAKAVQTIDSLKQLIESGKATFPELAAKFGQDATAAKGGDLGYVAQGRMVKPFDDLIFYQADKGKLYTVGTQFGYHLVEVTGKKFVKNKEGVRIGNIAKPIVPSEDTKRAVETRASNFAKENNTVEKMKKAAEADPNIDYVESTLVKENDYYLDKLGSNPTSREIIRWAFQKDTKTGEVNPKVYTFRAPSGLYEDKAAVAGLAAKVKAGLPPADVIKDRIKSLVLFKKKGQLIAGQIKAKDLNAIASQFNAKVDTSTNIAFANAFIPGIGNEPKVVATIFKVPVGQVSDPVIGTGGVFVIKVLRADKTDLPANIAVLQNQESAGFASQVKGLILEDLKKKAKIKDNRSTFY